MYQLPQQTHSLPPLRECPFRNGPLGCQPVPSLALPLPPNTHMPAGLAVVPAFGDGIEGLLAAHAHGDFLFPDGRRCPLPKIHILERGPGLRSETATPQSSPSSPCPCPCPKAWIITGRQQIHSEDLPLSPGSALPHCATDDQSRLLSEHCLPNDFSVALPKEDCASEVMHCLSGLYPLGRGEEHHKVRWAPGGPEGVPVQEEGVGTLTGELGGVSSSSLFVEFNSLKVSSVCSCFRRVELMAWEEV